MNTVKVKLPDGSEKTLKNGVTLAEAAKSVGNRLAKEALAARINGDLVDLSAKLENDVAIEFLTFDSEQGREVFRHSSSHLMAYAVQELFPGTKFGIGPAIEEGFYYDFDKPGGFTEEDLNAIEKKMREIAARAIPFRRREVSRKEAMERFRSLGEVYKVELLEGIEGDTVSLYELGDFVDLCRGPHVPDSSYIKAFKLTGLAGAYWRGDERNKMLQRIYGTSFTKEKDLKEHLHLLEEARKRDHRRLGRDLDLFSFHEEGPGFAFFHPKGLVVWDALMDFWRKEHRKRGYVEVRTPIILARSLWEQSGHWDNYRENMYFTVIDDRDFAIKPMNCPGGLLIYKTHLHSYREFPLRCAEVGLVHRHEKSGVLHGLFRVRQFTQDDAHIFLLPEQIVDEVVGIIEFVDFMYKTFGFSSTVELSTKPEKHIGSDEMWEQATSALKAALARVELDYKLNEGEGAFYGPKIDFHIRDCLKRTWQCATIQLDFALPEKFDLSYIGSDNQRHRPVMIHRTLYGSIERFLGVLIEHYGGAFPTWLAPVQAILLPVGESHRPYAATLLERLRNAGVRAEADLRDDKIGFKIREAQLQKVPYMLVVGDREVSSGAVSVRHRQRGDLGPQQFEDFLASLQAEIENRTL
ncbi:MAG: threonine--tRNA ligase [Candidatus Abyssobacteria bacterium SURF_17]|uniref:Threonine--tRNA ligase n=1 Tax=Candidatus Abyssobacteria bacterium SURF_17 TaxID=2093361 RepID=A0A419EWJ3_9BACT|nr:MAG: threonine--tRNA ligase [Candidatus Abyssubacteria bacterium SURF_17]